MQQQRKRRNRRGSAGDNANYTIDRSVCALIEGLTDTQYQGFDIQYLQSEYRSKYTDERLVSSKERRRAAIRKFEIQEIKNRGTNLRLRALPYGYNILPRVTWRTFLGVVQRMSSEILGPLDDSIVRGASFSGGASTSRSRRFSQPWEKFSGKADSTEGAASLVDFIYREAPLLKEYAAFDDLRIVDGAILFTVPKKTDIDRCACKEPDLNMFLQKSAGEHIRRKLRSVGINLNDQSRNRGLAELGSRNGTLATLDLSSASDSITISAVRAILPEEWFLFLNEIRSHNTVIDGRTYRNEMFSSMGNGFTFELESLIFLVLARATAYFRGISGTISIYGDDIIAPTDLYEDLVWVLQFFGFEVNEKKSFHDGPFRESCGGHYHNGNDVTPFYLKRRPTLLTDVIRVGNQLLRWLCTDPTRVYAYPQLGVRWALIRGCVPLRLWGGQDFNTDTALVTGHPPRSVLVRTKKDYEYEDRDMYLFWHNTRDHSSLPITEEPAETRRRCRVRKNACISRINLSLPLGIEG